MSLLRRESQVAKFYHRLCPRHMGGLEQVVKPLKIQVLHLQNWGQ